MKYAKHTNDMELKCLSVTRIIIWQKVIYPSIERRFFLQSKGSHDIINVQFLGYKPNPR